MASIIKKKSLAPIIGGIVVLCIVIGIVVYFVTTQDNRKEGEECEPTDDEKVDNADTYVIGVDDDDTKTCTAGTCISGYNVSDGQCSADKEDDIVVIQWTHLDRFCIIRDNSQYVDQCYNDEIVTMISAGRMEQGQGQSKLFFKHFHSISDMEVDMHTRIDYINFLLERKGITVFNFLAEPHYKRSFNWFETKLLDTTIGPIRHKLPTALDNSHPGEECMQVIADELYKEITELL